MQLNHAAIHVHDGILTYFISDSTSVQWVASGRSAHCSICCTPQDILAASIKCPVPKDQQPANELQDLQQAFLSDWATRPASEFLVRLIAVWAVFTFTLGLPVSLATFDIAQEPAQCLISASIGELICGG